MSNLVSIVTVTYNAEAFLEETIQSVIVQDYSNIEYIIVDGGSTDGTKAIVDKYRDHIDIFVSKADNGIYDAINKGIGLSSGRVIKIQNADDLLLPGAVSAAMEELGRYTPDEPLVVIGYSRVIGTSGNTLGRITGKPIIIGLPTINHPGWFATRSVYETHGLYSLDYRIASDYEYFLRIKTAGVRVVWIPRDVACYRQDGASAGFDGVREVARINREYYGPLRSAFVRVQHQGGKMLRPVWRWLRSFGVV